MKEECNFTLTVPLSIIDEAPLLLGEARQSTGICDRTENRIGRRRPVSISVSPAPESARTFSSWSGS